VKIAFLTREYPPDTAWGGVASAQCTLACAAMRYDLSFEDNRYTEYLIFVNSNKYDRIYSSSTFEIYSK